jgi:hypothetical protein
MLQGSARRPLAINGHIACLREILKRPRVLLPAQTGVLARNSWIGENNIVLPITANHHHGGPQGNRLSRQRTIEEFDHGFACRLVPDIHASIL